jgi:hypothetical protein
MKQGPRDIGSSSAGGGAAVIDLLGKRDMMFMTMDNP